MCRMRVSSSNRVMLSLNSSYTMSPDWYHNMHCIDSTATDSTTS